MNFETIQRRQRIHWSIPSRDWIRATHVLHCPYRWQRFPKRTTSDYERREEGRVEARALRTIAPYILSWLSSPDPGIGLFRGAGGAKYSSSVVFLNFDFFLKTVFASQVRASCLSSQHISDGSADPGARTIMRTILWLPSSQVLVFTLSLHNRIAKGRITIMSCSVGIDLLIVDIAWLKSGESKEVLRRTWTRSSIPRFQRISLRVAWQMVRLDLPEGKAVHPGGVHLNNPIPSVW